jgi:hypothetical protein
MALQLPRQALLCATALALTAMGSAGAFADDADRFASVEKQIKALQAELRHMKQEAAERDRQLKAAQTAAAHATAAPPASVMPVIPPGYALVPAAPGSTPGSVVLAKAEAPPEKKLPIGTFQVGAVNVTLGGFIEGASIYRSRNEVTDITSNWTTGIPFRNSQLYHEPEFRETERRSTIQGLADAHPDEVTDIEAFLQADFQGGAPTSNSNESNSFVPRITQGWAEYTRSDLGVTVLAGQSWSLLTMNQVGINPLRVNNPPTIDGGYVPGFDWTRQPQFRFGKSFDNDTYWLALSIENPQTTYSNTSVPSTLGTLNVSNPGIGGLGTGSNSGTSVCTAVTTTTTTTTTGGTKPVSKSTSTSTCTTANVASQASYSNNIAPDLIIKATADYPWAHLEAYGLGRLFNDRLSQTGTGQSNTVFGGGAGAAALFHVVPKMVDFQISGLAGDGIGRYGTVQLPDATIGPTGKPVPLREWMALAGIIFHATPQLDLYGYLGSDQTNAAYFDTYSKGKVSKSYGFGNPLYPNTSCDVELGSSADCTGTTKAVTQGTIGAWWEFLKGSYGTMQVGAQYSYTRRMAFQGVGPTPQTDDNMVFLAFRYYPFQ